MDEDLTPDELRELLGAFALGALDDDERAEVEDYVLDDADARAELHRLEHAVAWLGHASPRPSDVSWEAVRAEMAADLAADAADTDIAPVVDLATRRRSVPRWQRLTAAAAAVALVLGFGIAMFSVFTGDGSSNPTTTVALAAPDGQVAVTARLRTDGTGTIVRSSLPPAPSGHEYQLWAQPDPDASMHSVGLLGTDPDGHAIRVPAHTDRIAISVEPTGGSREPTTVPVAVSTGQL